MSGLNSNRESALDEILDNLFVRLLCRNTPLPIVEWGSQSMAYGAIIMHCRTCDAETQYYVDEEKTEKAIRDRVFSRSSERNIDEDCFDPLERFASGAGGPSEGSRVMTICTTTKNIP